MIGSKVTAILLTKSVLLNPCFFASNFLLLPCRKSLDIIFFLHKKEFLGLTRGSPLMWVIMCVWAPLGVQMLLLLSSFNQDIDTENIDFFFFKILNGKKRKKKICLAQHWFLIIGFENILSNCFFF